MKYNNGNFSWEHGQKMVGHNEWHKYLGPCPHCGSVCFNYGGGWRCLDPNCFYSYTNPMSDFGEAPDWWDNGINVIKDGNAWMAHGEDFINIQESDVAFGSTPKEAVKNYLQSQATKLH